MKCETENDEKFAAQDSVCPWCAAKGGRWIRTGLGLCLLLIFGQTAPAQVTGSNDVALRDLPPPPAAETADPAIDEVDVETDAVVDVESGNTKDALPPTSGAIIDAEPTIKGETDVDAAIEADAKPQLGEATRRNRPSASADVDSKHRGKLGVYVAESENRVTIHDVMAGGAAIHAGLEAGDEILSVNGQRITTSAQLRRNLRAAAESGKATVLVSRNAEVHTIEVDVSGHFVAEAEGDRRHTYYRGPHVGAPVDLPVAHWYSYPYYYGSYPYYYYPAYPYYYGYYGYYAPAGYYYACGW